MTESLHLKTWLQDEDFVVLVFVYMGPNLQPWNQQPWIPRPMLHTRQTSQEHLELYFLCFLWPSNLELLWTCSLRTLKVIDSRYTTVAVHKIIQSIIFQTSISRRHKKKGCWFLANYWHNRLPVAFHGPRFLVDCYQHLQVYGTFSKHFFFFKLINWSTLFCP